MEKRTTGDLTFQGPKLSWVLVDIHYEPWEISMQLSLVPVNIVSDIVVDISDSPWFVVGAGRHPLQFCTLKSEVSRRLLFHVLMQFHKLHKKKVATTLSFHHAKFRRGCIFIYLSWMYLYIFFVDVFFYICRGCIFSYLSWMYLFIFVVDVFIYFYRCLKSFTQFYRFLMFSFGETKN